MCAPSASDAVSSVDGRARDLLHGTVAVNGTLQPSGCTAAGWPSTSMIASCRPEPTSVAENETPCAPASVPPRGERAGRRRREDRVVSSRSTIAARYMRTLAVSGSLPASVLADEPAVAAA